MSFIYINKTVAANSIFENFKRNFSLNLASILHNSIVEIEAVSYFIIFCISIFITRTVLIPYAQFIAGNGPSGIPDSGGPNPNNNGGSNPGPKRLGLWLILLFATPLFTIKNTVPVFLFFGFALTGSAYLVQHHNDVIKAEEAEIA